MKKKTFTLVELLVVLTIILILASLLLPSLKKAYNLAKQVSCKNSMKTIGNGFYLYSSDYNFYLPCVYWVRIKDYIGVKGGSSATGYYSGGGKTRCPSAPNYNSSGEPLYVTYNYSGTSGASTSFLCSSTSGNMGNGMPWREFCVPISKVRAPSCKYLLVEGWKDTYGNTDYYWKSVTYMHHCYQKQRKVHDTGSNIVFVDGHLGSIALPFLAQYAETPSDYPQASCYRWNADP